MAIFGAGLCAGAASSAAEPQAPAVRMQKEAFVPASLSVAAGAKITWTNTDTVPHSVTADDKRFDSGPVLPGKSFEWTTSGAGTIAYHCIFHPSMTAAMTIRADAGPSGK
jgi:plastocyanin